LADRAFGRPQQTTRRRSLQAAGEIAHANPLAELSNEELRARLRELKGEAA
jgi:hypothetical protein